MSSLRPRQSFDRALHRVYSTPELGKDTVTRRVRYTAPVLPNELIEDRSPLSQSLERADFIGAHETAIAFHICCEDCNQLPADIRKL